MWEEDRMSNFLRFQELGREQMEVVTSIISLQHELLKIPDGIKGYYQLEFIRRTLLLIPKFPIDESILEKMEKAKNFLNNQ